MKKLVMMIAILLIQSSLCWAEQKIEYKGGPIDIKINPHFGASIYLPAPPKGIKATFIEEGMSYKIRDKRWLMIDPVNWDKHDPRFKMTNSISCFFEKGKAYQFNILITWESIDNIYQLNDPQFPHEEIKGLPTMTYSSEKPTPIDESISDVHTNIIEFVKKHGNLTHARKFVYEKSEFNIKNPNLKLTIQWVYHKGKNHYIFGKLSIKEETDIETLKVKREKVDSILINENQFKYRLGTGFFPFIDQELKKGTGYDVFYIYEVN